MNKILVLAVFGFLLVGCVSAYNHYSTPQPISEEEIISPSFNYSPFPRVVGVPQGGSYNYVNGDVKDIYGNIVSTRAEREAKW